LFSNKKTHPEKQNKKSIKKSSTRFFTSHRPPKGNHHLDLIFSGGVLALDDKPVCDGRFMF